ncbi:FHA domain-containing protein [Propionibacteriaceae bacterium Y1685]|uniref:FHA domain-containing protein n=1 Tax=Microlunatus sp. Y1700 TaxID=3418487 RepID=UPI003B7A0363
MPYCNHCGHDNPAGSNFCARCGEAVQKTSATVDQDTQANAVDSTQVMKPAVDDSTPRLSPDDQAAVESLPEGSALLIVQRGPSTGSRYLVQTDEVTAGRHPKSEIFLDDITVSREHAVLRRADGVITIEDKGSLNGTYVNRKVIEGAVELVDGDEVMIGKFRLVFHTSEPGRG